MMTEYAVVIIVPTLIIVIGVSWLLWDYKHRPPYKPKPSFRANDDESRTIFYGNHPPL